LDGIPAPVTQGKISAARWIGFWYFPDLDQSATEGTQRDRAAPLPVRSERPGPSFVACRLIEPCLNGR